jgi:hypothetical protein
MAAKLVMSCLIVKWENVEVDHNDEGVFILNDRFSLPLVKRHEYVTFLHMPDSFDRLTD